MFVMKMPQAVRWFFFLGCFVQNNSFAAQVTPATVTRVEGKVQVLRWPSSGKPKGPAPHVIFEGKHYSASDAFIGQKVMVGSIVRSYADGKIRLNYDNGDQLNIGPNSYMQINRNEDKSVLNVMFGEIRAVIQKGGPNGNLEVKTPSSAMGVRGTDFHVLGSTNFKKTDLTVISGEVALAATKPAGSKEKTELISVPAGFTAQLDTRKKEKTGDKPQKDLALFQSTKTQLSAVQNTASIKKPDENQLKEAQELVEKDQAIMAQIEEVPADQAQPQAVTSQIAALESASKKLILEEAKQADPALYEKLAKIDDPDLIQKESVETRKATAPTEAVQVKPDALPNYRKDIYKK